MVKVRLSQYNQNLHKKERKTLHKKRKSGYISINVIKVARNHKGAVG